MRVLITGDRHWICRDLAHSVLSRLAFDHGAENLVIVHGSANGVDETFAGVAHALGIACEAHPANWWKYDRRAGPIRNAEMVAAGAEFCLAFHPDLRASKGTKDCVLKALDAGIPVYLFESDTMESRLFPEPITKEFFD